MDQPALNKHTVENAFRKWRIRGYSITYTPRLSKQSNNGYIEFNVERVALSQQDLLALREASKDVPEPFGSYLREIKATHQSDGFSYISYRFRMSETFFQQALIQAYNDALDEAFTETLEDELTK